MMQKDNQKDIDSCHNTRYVILALYKFVDIPKDHLTSLQREVEDKLRSVHARGTILLATEGINGTICYPENLAGCTPHDSVQEYFQNHSFFLGLRTRISYADMAVFHRLKVKIKKEIVTIGGDSEESDVCKQPIGYMSKCDIDPTKIVGQYVPPGKEWDELCDDPDVVVIDTRNKYEYDIGTFENAINPNTDNFRQFPDWLHRFAEACKTADDSSESEAEHVHRQKQPCVMNSKKSESVNENLHPINTVHNARNSNPVPDEDLPIVRKKPKAVAMFCTGGIRCEKSTSYTIAANVFPKDIPVYHLEGGVLAYLEAHPDEKQSKWKGECFVFDQRVAVTHGLKPSTTYHACYGCRRPISLDDMNRPDFVEGVSCRYCKDVASEKQRNRFQERQKQIELSQTKGCRHIHDPKEVTTEQLILEP